MESNVVELDRSEGSDEQKDQKKWEDEIKAAQKRNREFIKQGNRVVSRYYDQRSQSSDFGISAVEGHEFRLNIFHSSINTMQAMLFGNKPKTDVSREHKDPDDDVARVAAVIGQRLIDVGSEPSGDDFCTALKSSLFDALTPGLGVSRVRYEFDSYDQEIMDQTGQPVIWDGEPVTKTIISNEKAPVDYVHWQDFLWGWGRTWAELPWIAFRSYLTKKEAKARFGEEKAKSLNYRNQLPTGDEEDQSANSEIQDSREKAEIWEIWSKIDQKVYWFADGQSAILDSKDDPLKLNGFFPCPMPMASNLTTTFFMPRADFVIDQDLYNQIDTLQTRIANITKTVKVVGGYDASIEGIHRIMDEATENQLVPIENWTTLGEKGGLNGVIEWIPLKEVVETLATLRQLLSETIALLYQITGMSDLLRGGNTDQYTSDGTNQLKARYGSIRMQSRQDDFARFASDLQSLRLQVISNNFSPESIVKQSSAMFLPQADHDKVPPAIELLKSPEIKWRAEVKPESIALMDFASLKNERVEYLTAISTYVQSAQAMAKSVPGSMPILLEFMKFGMAGFRGADYMEGILDQAIEHLLKNPPQPQDDGKAQAQQAAEQTKLQIEQIKSETKLQSDQAQFQIKQLEANSEKELEQLRSTNAMMLEKLDTANKIAVENTKKMNTLEVIAAQLQAQLTETQADTESSIIQEEAQSSAAIAEKQVDHKYTLIEDANRARLEDKGDTDA